MQAEKVKTIRLIIGDQLNYLHSWYQTLDSEVLYVLMEVKAEAAYVTHHAQKVIGIFAAMYNFSQYLTKKGHRVLHLFINDPRNKQSITANLEWIIKDTEAQFFEYQWPDEYRVDRALKEWALRQKMEVKVFDTEHFLTQRTGLVDVMGEKKQYLMETFYRRMRVKYQVLMRDQQPIGGQWNYDHENRAAYRGVDRVAEPLLFKHDFTDIWQEIQKAQIHTMGEHSANEFNWPVTRKEALQLLAYFVRHLLPWFGKYQDAMHTQHHFLFHSRLSFAMNLKMIHPLEIIQCVETSHYQQPEKISVAQAEGFIRQILGWREYMRGVYWKRMPEFENENFFNHQRPLPKWYWTGKTKMNCLKVSITQSLEQAYAHHIQRLMVTGNFALLSGVHPKEVEAWYLGIYIDAIQWVELPNTLGMSQFADGGVLGTKPYISAAAYIDKMSNYCKSCYYSKSLRYGDRACPFNSLYWHFYIQHAEQLKGHARIALMLKSVEKMDPLERQKIVDQAQTYLHKIDEL